MSEVEQYKSELRDKIKSMIIMENNAKAYTENDCNKKNNVISTLEKVMEVIK